MGPEERWGELVKHYPKSYNIKNLEDVIKIFSMVDDDTILRMLFTRIYDTEDPVYIVSKIMEVLNCQAYSIKYLDNQNTVVKADYQAYYKEQDKVTG